MVSSRCLVGVVALGRMGTRRMINLNTATRCPSSVLSRSLRVSVSPSFSSFPLSVRGFATGGNQQNSGNNPSNSYTSSSPDGSPGIATGAPGSSTTKSYSSSQVLPQNIFSQASRFMNRLSSSNEIELYHLSHVVLAVGLPVALVLSPSYLNVPIDFGLGLVIPFHGHIGMINVIEDYVPPPYRPVAKSLLIVITLLTTIGILKVNLCGQGITESVKSLWRKPPPTITTQSHTQSTQTAVVQTQTENNITPVKRV